MTLAIDQSEIDFQWNGPIKFDIADNPQAFILDCSNLPFLNGFFSIEAFREWRCEYMILNLRSARKYGIDLLVCHYGGVDVSLDIRGGVLDLHLYRGQALFIGSCISYRMQSTWMSGAMLMLYHGDFAIPARII